MSTRCTITAKVADGSFKSIYCHHDGYPEHVGNVLTHHYASTEKIEALMALGDLSALDTTTDQCVAYGRDRGENRTEAGVGATAKAALDDGGYGEQRHNYVWDGKCWFADGAALAMPADAGKHKYVKVSDPEGNFVIGDLKDTIESLVGVDLQHRGVGEKFTIEVVEMTKAEYDALPEFQG